MDENTRRLAQFLLSEKDTRPHWETDQRAMLMPLVMSGYNNSVAYGVPSFLGGHAWSTMGDIVKGNAVHPDEIAHSANDAAGAAMLGSMPMSAPKGAIRSGAARTTPETGIRAYHGSNADIGTFDRPAYFSPDKSYASKFGKNVYEADITPVNPYYTSDQMFIEGLRSFPERAQALRDKGHDAAILSGSDSSIEPIMGLGGLIQPQIYTLDPSIVRKSGIRAYHGSPHDFDRFDMSKIGTGEGAQAFGHGLYFAENEGTAKSYRDALGATPPSWGLAKDGRYFSPDGASYWGMQRVNEKLAEKLPYGSKDALPYSDIVNAINAVKADAATLKGPNGDKLRNELSSVEALVANNPDLSFMRNPPTGRMYEVNIKADPNDFLDWDKPLTSQPSAVKDRYLQALGALGNPNPQKVMDSSFASSGEGLENLLQAWSKYDRAKASAALREAGIPGIKYLDQGSRGAGKGSHNYVVFDDKLVEILRKYGLAGILAGGYAMTGQEPQE